MEVQVLDFIFATSTSQQWAELLKGPLELAAHEGNGCLAKRLVGAGAPIGNALHAAVRGGHGDLVNDLLEMGAYVNGKEPVNRHTPLHIAVNRGEKDMVHLLMLKGADAGALDANGWTPLFTAALFFQSKADAALALLAGGADVSLRCCGTSTLHMAAKQGHVEFLRVAFEHGADVDATDTDGSTTALNIVASRNNTEAINVILEAGGNTESRALMGFGPLHSAASNLNIEAVTALLKHGAHINALDDYLRTPLCVAAGRAGTHGAAKIVDILLRSGADETIVDDQGNTAADAVGEGIEEEDADFEDVEEIERVHTLLANAPADRAWRRRGYLVLCRAHPDRIQQRLGSSSELAGTGRRTRGGDRLKTTEARGCSDIVGGSAMGEGAGGGWADVMANVLGLQEEGIFRTIAGYL